MTDDSHNTEIKRGVTTSGEPQGKYVKDKPLEDELKQGWNQVKDSAKENINQMAKNAEEKAGRQVKGAEKATDEKKTDSFAPPPEQSTKSTVQDVTGWDKELQRADEEKSKVKAKDQRMVGNVDRRILSDGSPVNAPGVVKGPSSVTEEARDPDSERSYSVASETMDTDAKESYDVAARTMEKAKTMEDPDDLHPESIKPGTFDLRYPEDSFEKDPGVSFGDIQDKTREMKDKVKEKLHMGRKNAQQTAENAQQAAKETKDSAVEGTDTMMNNLKNSMMNTGREIKETMKGVSEKAQETVGHPITRTKEFLTGERESEKPDETKSEVRKKGKDAPGHQVSQPGSSEEATKPFT